MFQDIVLPKTSISSMFNRSREKYAASNSLMSELFLKLNSQNDYDDADDDEKLF